MDEKLFIPICELPKRYNVSRPTLYDRIKYLKISTPRMANKKHISMSDLELLDKFHQHLLYNRDKKTFNPNHVPDTEITPQNNWSEIDIVAQENVSIKPRQPEETGITLGESDLLVLIDKIINAVQKPNDLFDTYRLLKESSENEWILPTELVQQLIKVKPHGKEFRWGNFVFIRSGKVGRSAGWLVGVRSSSP